MKGRILCVDDEPRVLQGIDRILGWDFEVKTSTSGAEALEMLAQAEAAGEPIAAVISDMRMPNMDGAEFLSRVRTRFPHVTRILLTGFTDIESAMKAVNEGAIFRLLLKPCPPETLEQTALEAIEQNRLLTAEEELLDKTLQGAIEALVETLSLASPIAFSRATNIRDMVRHMSRDSPSRWMFETAALFAHMGLVAVPSEVIEKFVAQQPLEPHEREMIEKSSSLAAQLVEHVPRLEKVGAVLRGIQAGSTSDDPDIAQGVALVRAAIDVDLMVLRGTPLREALKPLAKRHNPVIVGLLDGFESDEHGSEVRSVTIAQLDTSMTFEADVHLESGQLLVKKGQPVTPALQSRLENFDRSAGVKQPILVRTR